MTDLRGITKTSVTDFSTLCIPLFVAIPQHPAYNPLRPLDGATKYRKNN